MTAIANPAVFKNSYALLSELWGGSPEASDTQQTSLNKICQQTYFTSRPTDSNITSEGKVGIIGSIPSAHVTVTESVLKEIKLFAQNPVLIDKAIFALVHAVDAKLTDRILTQSQQNVVRQMNDSAAEMIEIGFTLKQDDGYTRDTIDCSPGNRFSQSANLMVESFHSAFQMRLLANALMTL